MKSVTQLSHNAAVGIEVSIHDRNVGVWPALTCTFQKDWWLTGNRALWPGYMTTLHWCSLNHWPHRKDTLAISPGQCEALCMPLVHAVLPPVDPGTEVTSPFLQENEEGSFSWRDYCMPKLQCLPGHAPRMARNCSPTSSLGQWLPHFFPLVSGRQKLTLGLDFILLIPHVFVIFMQRPLI